MYIHVHCTYSKEYIARKKIHLGRLNDTYNVITNRLEVPQQQYDMVITPKSEFGDSHFIVSNFD